MTSGPHLVEASGWGMWRDFVLRSTGFSVELLEALGGEPDPGELRRLGRLPRLREALAWQNRAFLGSGLAWLDRHAERRNWRARANERTLLLYLQRYATRNESVGFFGPVAWGRLRLDGAPLEVQIGPELVDGRRVEWESWALDAFARRVGIALPIGAAATAPARLSEALATAPAEAREAWRTLEAARERLAAAAGDAEAVERAMGELEREFSRGSGAPATREAGRQTAGRTVVREDCRRAAALTVGPGVWRRTAGALEWLLAAQRWVTDGAGAIVRSRLDVAFADCAVAGRAPMRDFLPRARAVLEGFGAPRDPEVGERAAEARRRVRAILALPDLGPCKERLLQRSAVELGRAAEVAFAGAQPGWPSARYHCPDLLVAADSVESAARGELQLVLGELHSARNTVDFALYHGVHPEPGRLAAAIDADLGGGRVHFTAQPESPNGAAVPFFTDGDGDGDGVMFEWSEARSAEPRARVVTPADLEVRRAGGGLRVVSSDGREWDVLQFFDQMMPAFGAMLPYADHSPRITVDEVVIARESWKLDGAALDFAREPTLAARLRATRLLAGAHGLPRRIFVRTPLEPKPIYVDLESAPFVELMAHLARRAPWMRVTEMLPEPGGCWLRDAIGHRYTSELRLVLLDPRPPRTS